MINCHKSENFPGKKSFNFIWLVSFGFWAYTADFFTQVESVCNQLDSTTVSTSTNTNQQPDEQEQVGGGPSKLSKAEKRRQKKEQDDLKREAEIKAAEEANRYGPRNIETQSIKQQLKDRGLTIHEIPSNGWVQF